MSTERVTVVVKESHDMKSFHHNCVF